MQAGDGSGVRMLNADQGEGELENEGEEEEGGDAMEGREGVVNALPSVSSVSNVVPALTLSMSNGCPVSPSIVSWMLELVRSIPSSRDESARRTQAAGGLESRSALKLLDSFWAACNALKQAASEAVAVSQADPALMNKIQPFVLVILEHSGKVVEARVVLRRGGLRG